MLSKAKAILWVLGGTGRYWVLFAYDQITIGVHIGCKAPPLPEAAVGVVLASGATLSVDVFVPLRRSESTSPT